MAATTLDPDDRTRRIHTSFANAPLLPHVIPGTRDDGYGSAAPPYDGRESFTARSQAPYQVLPEENLAFRTAPPTTLLATSMDMRQRGLDDPRHGLSQPGRDNRSVEYYRKMDDALTRLEAHPAWRLAQLVAGKRKVDVNTLLSHTLGAGGIQPPPMLNTDYLPDPTSIRRLKAVIEQPLPFTSDVDNLAANADAEDRRAQATLRRISATQYMRVAEGRMRELNARWTAAIDGIRDLVRTFQAQQVRRDDTAVEAIFEAARELLRNIRTVLRELQDIGLAYGEATGKQAADLDRIPSLVVIQGLAVALADAPIDADPADFLTALDVAIVSRDFVQIQQYLALPSRFFATIERGPQVGLEGGTTAVREGTFPVVERGRARTPAPDLIAGAGARANNSLRPRERERSRERDERHRSAATAAVTEDSGARSVLARTRLDERAFDGQIGLGPLRTGDGGGGGPAGGRDDMPALARDKDGFEEDEGGEDAPEPPPRAAAEYVGGLSRVQREQQDLRAVLSTSEAARVYASRLVQTQNRMDTDVFEYLSQPAVSGTIKYGPVLQAGISAAIAAIKSGRPGDFRQLTDERPVVFSREPDILEHFANLISLCITRDDVAAPKVWFTSRVGSNNRRSIDAEVVWFGNNVDWGVNTVVLR